MDSSEEQQQQLKRQNNPNSTTITDGTHTPIPELETAMSDVPQSPPHKKTKFIALGPEIVVDREVTPTPIVNNNPQLPAITLSSISSAVVAPTKRIRLEMSLNVELIEGKDGKAPTQGSALAAGYDLYSSEDGVIPARGRGIIKTGIKIAVPPGTYGRVAPRSGLAVKHGIDTGAGVIDADYRGEVGVILFNFSDEDFEVKKHDRIAQLILEKIVSASVVVVSSLTETARGEGAYGSTGGFGNTPSVQ